MVDQNEFFMKYRIDKKSFNSYCIDWNELIKIKSSQEEASSDMFNAGTYLASSLQGLNEVHSVRLRIKDSEHLMEKIIRKKVAGDIRKFTVNTYSNEITDLIGIRALHLFKEDWIPIHEFIVNNWELIEDPIAYVRRGDSGTISKDLEAKGCNVQKHGLGYRSIHYIIKSQPKKDVFIAEIQVRTIFEEGWSEIDHRVRYPYYQDNDIC